VIAADRLRPPSLLDLTAAAYKDWLHVNVFDFARGRIALVNVSLHGDPDDPRSLAAGAVLVGDVEDGWRQHVESVGAREAVVAHGAIAVGEVAAIVLDETDGSVSMSGRLPGGALELDATALPAAPPIVAEAPAPFGSGWIAWRATPRLRVTGRLRLDGETTAVDETAAYHDHNWGRWFWGDDVGWEWGAFLSPDGASFVTTRPTDRAHRAGGTALRAHVGGQARAFHERTVRARLEGRLEGVAPRGPGAMAALHSARARPLLPSRVHVVADDGYDRVELEAKLVSAAQIVVAEPARPGYGFIHELIGTFAYSARVGGVASRGEGLVAFEHVD
jgi:hypothetical protein